MCRLSSPFTPTAFAIHAIEAPTWSPAQGSADRVNLCRQPAALSHIPAAAGMRPRKQHCTQDRPGWGVAEGKDRTERRAGSFGESTNNDVALLQNAAVAGSQEMALNPTLTQPKTNACEPLLTRHPLVRDVPYRCDQRDPAWKQLLAGTRQRNPMCPTSIKDTAPTRTQKCSSHNTQTWRERGSRVNSPELQLPQLGVDRAGSRILHAALVGSGSV